MCVELSKIICNQISSVAGWGSDIELHVSQQCLCRCFKGQPVDVLKFWPDTGADVIGTKMAAH